MKERWFPRVKTNKEMGRPVAAETKKQEPWFPRLAKNADIGRVDGATEYCSECRRAHGFDYHAQDLLKQIPICRACGLEDTKMTVADVSEWTRE